MNIVMNLQPGGNWVMTLHNILGGHIITWNMTNQNFHGPCHVISLVSAFISFSVSFIFVLYRKRATTVYCHTTLCVLRIREVLKNECEITCYLQFDLT
jgi:hypothetical protein